MRRNRASSKPLDGALDCSALELASMWQGSGWAVEAREQTMAEGTWGGGRGWLASWLAILAAFVAVCLPRVATGQTCGGQWLPNGEGIAGVNGTVNAAVMWDSDGAGPLPPRLAVGGGFGVAGPVAANNIAAFDQATSSWSALGTGMNGQVNALAVLPNGDLIAGGDFTTAGGVSASTSRGGTARRGRRWGTGMNNSGHRPCRSRQRRPDRGRRVRHRGWGDGEPHRAVEWHVVVNAGDGDGRKGQRPSPSFPTAT
jgi:hypothetical protein